MMVRTLCAYDGHAPGSASEKLQQRADLEAFNQLEEESLCRAKERLPAVHPELSERRVNALPHAEWLESGAQIHFRSEVHAPLRAAFQYILLSGL